VRHQGGSLLRFGDLSVLSFHATKVFNTFEGGAIISPDAKTKLRIDRLKNFGFVDEVTVVAPGINAKMSEINAAFGLLQLQNIDDALAQRQAIDTRYRQLLQNIPGIRCVDTGHAGQPNYSYFPILIEDDYPCSRDAIYQRLREQQIFARRYFYPLISEFPMYRGIASAHADNLPVASHIAQRILCLPIYPGLQPEQQAMIVDVLARA